MASPTIETGAEAEQASPEQPFTLRQKLGIWLISSLATLWIRLIAPTLRWSVSAEDGGTEDNGGKPTVFAFWHQCIITAMLHYHDREIVVMTSSSFDGEYIARIVEKFGYRAARGSSTRGGVRALLSMHKDLEAGRSVAFTIDGPKGPKYVAKPGPVLLARNTQKPLLCFHIALDRAWVLHTWDNLMIPKPFAHAALRASRMMEIPRDADSAALEHWHAQMQQALDRVRVQAEESVAGRGD